MESHRVFDRRAESYDSHNLIQRRAASRLLAHLKIDADRIVDLGCGTGTLYRLYERPFTHWIAVDAAPAMLALHPQSPRIEKRIGNFDDAALFEELAESDFDLLLSSSALQWAEDIDWTLAQIAKLNKPTALNIFTSGTFATLHRLTGRTSPIHDRETIEKALIRRLGIRPELCRYRLYFRSTRDMLRYIQRSGVGGGAPRLSISQMRRLLESYPLNYLEFELLRGTSF